MGWWSPHEVNLLPTRYCLNIIMPQDLAIISQSVFHLCSCGPLAAVCPSNPWDKWRLISPRTCICDQVCSLVVWFQICPIVHHTEEQLVAALPLLVPGKLCPFSTAVTSSCHCSQVGPTENQMVDLLSLSVTQLAFLALVRVALRLMFVPLHLCQIWECYHVWLYSTWLQQKPF